MPAGKGPSSLLLQEYFAAEDPRFLEILRQVSDRKTLVNFVERWKKDNRPWARAQIADLVQMRPDRPSQRLLIKRLFKHAEANRDHELMGVFLAAFDRLVRRRRVWRYHYDPQLGQEWAEEALQATPAWPFSNRTCNYLRRRAWRYFRRLGHQKPGEYVSAIAGALKRYRDDDLAAGENILDCWGLMHACFFEHELVQFSPAHASIKRGSSLGQLTAAPYFSELWQAPSAAGVLLELLAEARSRLVRVWAMQLLRRDHKDRLADISPERVLRLLDHADEEVQQFGAELLAGLRGLENLPLATWRTMLQTRNLAALEAICQLMRQHVPPDRFELAELVELASARAVPVARLGLEMLKSRSIDGPEQRREIARLAEARCGGIGQELALWALGILGQAGAYETDTVAAFFDSLVAEIRRGAWEWLKEDSAGYNDSALFSRLLETPYEDLRLRLVEMLQKRANLPGTHAGDLAGIWCAVLLGIHRGGRQKLKALAQISAAIRRETEHAQALVPVLAIAIRSVRLPEARQGLAALVAAVEVQPQLVEVCRRFLPELELSPQGVGA